jgi:hypothetical protein
VGKFYLPTLFGVKSVGTLRFAHAALADAGIFAALKGARLFQQVNIELGAITWPNGADLDPVWVHDEVGKNWSVPG